MENLADIKSDFIAQLFKGRKTKASVKALCEGYIQALFSYKKADGSNLSIATIRKAISTARKAVRIESESKGVTARRSAKWAIGSGESFASSANDKYGYLLAPKDILDAHNSQKTKNLAIQKSRKLDASHITPGLVNDLLNSQSARLIAIGLALATGRRSAELLVTGKFKKVRGAGNGFAMFSGQVKAKADKAPYIIPLAFGVTLDAVNKGVKLLRAATMFKDIEASNKFAPALMRATKSELGAAFKFHDCRKIYVAWCVENILSEGNDIIRETTNGIVTEDEGDYTTAILGHESMTSKEFYKNIKLVRS